MPYRNKILIIEHDDFLREIIGNLLHKRGGYILNGVCIQDGIKESRNHKITTVILGTSCPDYKGKETLGYIKREMENPNIRFYILNDTNKELPFVGDQDQIQIKDLSVQEILDAIEI